MAEICDHLEPLGSAWLDGALDPAEAEAFRAHLTACAACRGEVDDLARTRALLRSLPVRRMPPWLLAEVPADADHLAGATVPPPPSGTETEAEVAGPRQRIAPRAAAAALAVVGVIGGAAFSLGDQPHDARTVAVPVDLFVADHVAQTVQGPVWSPVLVEATQ